MGDIQQTTIQKQIPAQASQNSPSEHRLVDAKTLLKLIWDEGSRPSLRWLRQQQADRTLPFIKIGARVWFDPTEIRQCLKEGWKFGERKDRKNRSK